MLKASKIFIFSFYLFFAADAFACSLKAGGGYVSLAGPVTMLLQELELLDDKRLKAISVFHPLKKENKNLTRLAGGVFLSPAKLAEYKTSVVFFDESSELDKALRQAGVREPVEIVTRGLDPFEANEAAMKALTPHLFNCSSKLKALRAELQALKKKLVRLRPERKVPYVFYLGELASGERPPQLVIGDDGFVKFLRDRAKLKSYPTSLAYVPWSSRILNKFGSFLGLGVREGEGSFQAVKIDRNRYNLKQQGVLTPGLSQIEFLSKLEETSLFKLAPIKEKLK